MASSPHNIGAISLSNTGTSTEDSTVRSPGEETVADSLARRIATGDIAAEGELVQRYQRGVMQILKCATYDTELARDLCQDTFVIVIRRLRDAPLNDPGRLAGFIAQTARNLAIGAKRQYSRRRTSTDTESVESAIDQSPTREQQAEADSAAAVVHKLLIELRSERDRLALARFYLNEDSKEQICAELKLTESQFNVILFRARERLRELLERRGIGRRDLLGVALL
jgi:RNA polymerase sigma-70 factor, ECF subfamily